MEIVMALPARKIETEESMEARIARLEAHTEHIQSHVQDLRQDMKGLRQEMKEFTEKIDAKFVDLQKALESMKIGRVWDRVWILLAMGALLSVMARGFKWI
jgi:phage shock protein A